MDKPLRRLAFEAFERPKDGDDEAEYRYQRDEHQWERVAKALVPPPDSGPPRPDDTAELAKLVAKELRKRGFFADYWRGHAITLPCYVGHGSAKVYRYLPICLDLSQFDNLGPRAIADVIQAEEAKRAAEWAGDANG